MVLQDIQIAFEQNSLLAISEIEQVGLDCVKITSKAGPVFFIRISFLQTVSSESLYSGAILNQDQSEDILNAALAFACERKAEDYLSRCEQYRSGLTQKLILKGFSKQSIKTALNYLESRNLLSDSRYCEVWLRSHGKAKKYGRTRLFSELLSKGIDRSICNQSIESFFLENSEEEFCSFIYKKALFKGKAGEKLIKYLIDYGFSYKLIRCVIKNESD